MFYCYIENGKCHYTDVAWVLRHLKITDNFTVCPTACSGYQSSISLVYCEKKKLPMMKVFPEKHFHAMTSLCLLSVCSTSPFHQQISINFMFWHYVGKNIKPSQTSCHQMPLHLIPSASGQFQTGSGILEVKLTFEMLTVRGQQHLFWTHERVFLWKCQSFWDRKCLNLRGNSNPQPSDSCRML